MKKVLIALDYNPTAQKVAEEGYALAKAMHADVTLIHIISEPITYSSNIYSPIMGFSGYMDLDFMQSDIIVGIKKTSEYFLNKTKQHLGDDHIKTLIGEGDFATSILEAAKEIGADLIVIGTHSHRWLDKILVGSVAEKILSHTTIPLFIIPTKKKE